ncbi:unnamed protein product, partial [Allacma fusca]
LLSFINYGNSCPNYEFVVNNRK